MPDSLSRILTRGSVRRYPWLRRGRDEQLFSGPAVAFNSAEQSRAVAEDEARSVLAFAVHGVKTGGARMREKKPNILILWGDDIGYWNISTTTAA